MSCVICATFDAERGQKTGCCKQPLCLNCLLNVAGDCPFCRKQLIVKYEKYGITEDTFKKLTDKMQQRNRDERRREDEDRDYQYALSLLENSNATNPSLRYGWSLKRWSYVVMAIILALVYAVTSFFGSWVILAFIVVMIMCAWKS